MSSDREFGIVANVLETDRLFPDGAKVWIARGTGGEGWYRFCWLGRTRGGRIVEKWAPTMRFHNFRAAWVPDHLQERVYYLRGTRSEMDDVAARLTEFAAAERDAHPDRRGARQGLRAEGGWAAEERGADSSGVGTQRIVRALTWPLGFVYGFVVGASRAFVSEFRRTYRQQRSRR